MARLWFCLSSPAKIIYLLAGSEPWKDWAFLVASNTVCLMPVKCHFYFSKTTCWYFTTCLMPTCNLSWWCTSAAIASGVEGISLPNNLSFINFKTYEYLMPYEYSLQQAVSRQTYFVKDLTQCIRIVLLFMHDALILYFYLLKSTIKITWYQLCVPGNLES